MNTNQWFEEVNKKIEEDVAGFYRQFFRKSALIGAGNDYRVNPSPCCNHNDCCTVTPGMATVHCFSCGKATTHANFLLEQCGDMVWFYKTLSEYYSLPIPEDTDEDEAARRIQVIRHTAVDFYHSEFLHNTKHIEYQLKNRRHGLDILKKKKIGASTNYLRLHDSLIKEGFTKEEIKEARVWFPDDLIVYPYFNPFTGAVVRFNTKNPFNVTLRDSGGNDVEVQGFSVGDKAFYIGEGFNKKYCILVEGENDEISLEEENAKGVIAMGGNISKVQLQLLDKLLGKVELIYTMFDNDEVGQKYTDMINDWFAHKDVRRIKYDGKDPDEYYKSGKSKPIEDLMRSAEQLKTKQFRFFKERNVCTLVNREQKLVFEMHGVNKAGNIVGNASHYKKGEIQNKASDSDIMKFAKPLNFRLLDEIDKRFNENIEGKEFHELVDAHKYSRMKRLVEKRLAKIIYEDLDDGSIKPKYIDDIKTSLGNEVADLVLKEFNDIQNKALCAVLDYAEIPKIKLSHFFSFKNDDAFFYFTAVRPDGDTIRKLPYLITNKKEQIRLDLLQRKDPQCILLVKNRYELSEEVPAAIMDLQETSLSQYWVEKWVNGEIDPAELQPHVLIQRIERFVRRFFYSADDNIYKIVALWIFGTYAYELFGQYPYLFLNGRKGTGKSSLDQTIYMLGFNAKMAVSITEAALFRGITFEGGTYILDEMENMTSRTKANEQGMGGLLKGGYARAGKTYRCNTEKGNAQEGFDLYCPKVISNIFGLEDVIADRCIIINTYEVPQEVIKRLEDPKLYQQEYLGEYRELSSKCALSVLTNFQHIYRAYQNAEFLTGNARLSQILRPIVTLAAIAGQDYLDAFNSFYDSSLRVSKDEVESNTPEGVLKELLGEVASEIVGKKEKNLLVKSNHKYQNEITIRLEDGEFDLDSLHIRCFMEEYNPNFVPDVRQVNTYVKRAVAMDLHKDRKRTTVTIQDETLIEELNDIVRMKVYLYTFRIRDILPDWRPEDKASAKAVDKVQEKIARPTEPVRVKKDIKLDGEF